MTRVVDVFAEYELAKIRQRTKDGVRVARDQGRVAGPKSWSTFTRGQRTIQLVKRLRAEGLTNRAIVRWCYLNSVFSPHRGKITLAHVRKCLESKYPEAEIDETTQFLLLEVQRARFYESKFVSETNEACV
jgi:DNA invertase Pin-like site-specific DNA recombinase